MKDKLGKYLKRGEFDTKNALFDIHNIEIQALQVYMEMYENNVDCFSNVEYLNLFNHTKRKLEAEITKEEEVALDQIEKKNESLCKNWLDDNYYKIEKAAGEGFEQYMKAYMK